MVAIDDDHATLDLISQALRPCGVEVHGSANAQQGLELVRRLRPGIVFVDLNMPGVDGMTLLDAIAAFDPGIQVVMFTGHYSTDSAIEAIRHGAADYITKPVTSKALAERVQKLIENAGERHAIGNLEHELLRTAQFQGLIGKSPAMLHVFSQVRRIAPHFRTVLVSGATGTGKELIAGALHRLSPAGSGPFVVCNAAALVEGLAESELFGHVKGAFTGASGDKTGFFESAHGGTLFLDEIGEISLQLQAKLLRVLQQQEVQKVGSTAVKKINARVIAATNRNLYEQAQLGRFREDLYYRLAMVEVHLPPLAERREDLLLLQRHFVAQYSKAFGKNIKGITRRAQEQLARYAWPGNVRELENVIGRACMLTDGPVVDVQHLPAHITTILWPQRDGELVSLRQAEQMHVRRVLDAVGGNKQKAAAILGIARATLYSLLAEDEERERLSPAAAGERLRELY
ncbi:MAG TPA: sigma-54 dependent transcriptional regulator [Terriglobales bacterium]|nr:sigma-54 dependent transcriptional regulator [Terriglobales bacterium]